ncbi:MAG: molybdopterin-dependent oxidoreductase [Nannocystaceae bacterium]
MIDLDATAGLAEHATARELSLPDELELRPTQGVPKWFGNTIARWVFRAASMEEQPISARQGGLSPIEGYYRRDRHVHPRIDSSRYQLKVTGVAQDRSFALADLRALPQTERLCVMECAGNGNHLMGSAGLMGQARWKGPSLAAVLSACGGSGSARHFAFRGLDSIRWLKSGYHYGLSLDELCEANAVLALTMNGEPLSRRHGFPLRLMVPRIYSMSHVKWLGHIEGKTRRHRGVHNDFVFTNKELRDGQWVRVQARWIGLKSLVTRCRRVPGGWVLHGWAWGGEHPIERLEVSTDGGESWQGASLAAASGSFAGENAVDERDARGAWSTFAYHWKQPAPGVYSVAARAFDSDGTPQRMHEDTQVKGHFNQCRVKWRSVVIPAES